MYLFGLEGSGFIISLALILLISGAIMFYCLKRFAILENSLLEQGRILQSFIVKMQNENNINSASNQERDFIVKPTNEKSEIMNTNSINSNTQKSNLIEVSDDDLNSDYSNQSNDDDDEDDDDDDDDDDEDEEDEEDEDDNDDDNDNTNSQYNKNKLDNKVNDEINNTCEINTLDNSQENDCQDNNGQNNSIKIISVEDMTPDLLNMGNVLNLESSNSELNSDTISSVNNDDNDITNNILTIESQVKKEIEKGGITKMKVADLRILVLEKGLVNSMEDANQIKKNNLIKLLQEK